VVKATSSCFWIFARPSGSATRKYWRRTYCQKTLAVANLYKVRFLHGSFLEALMSMACVESQNPDGFAQWAPALEKHYGVPRKYLGWFLEHVTADSIEDGHGGVAFAILEKYAISEEVQRNVRQAVGETLSSYWMMFDGIYRTYVGGRGAGVIDSDGVP
jgi:pyrroloquinoline quinone (PQQ) biosynthesis protein C